MNNIISVVFCRQLSIRQTIFIHPFISAGIGGDLFMSYVQIFAGGCVSVVRVWWLSGKSKINSPRPRPCPRTHRVKSQK